MLLNIKLFERVVREFLVRSRSIFSSIELELNVPRDVFSSTVSDVTVFILEHGFKKSGSALDICAPGIDRTTFFRTDNANLFDLFCSIANYFAHDGQHALIIGFWKGILCYVHTSTFIIKSRTVNKSFVWHDFFSHSVYAFNI